MHGGQNRRHRPKEPTTTAILFEQIVQQPVVPRNIYRDDLSAKRRPPSKLENSGSGVDIFLIEYHKARKYRIS